ncbi:tetratricopeptide repeat protein [Streptomyces sp. TRM S81-3]|uniref:Tetratricopeptide repeat protein n=1 Tax=Streptomyces griseicoloratus TaxID=2752516 RepID=A0A926L351_9ACTN|nr:tetratricopeptide repeat protein [Streptomyces griseicoloratus]
MGKTQLAAEYVRSVEQDLDVLVWVTASSRSSIVAAYAEAAVELCGADAQDPERAAQKFLQRLDAAGQPVLRWLIVLDSLADPGNLNHELYPSLWPPPSAHGRSLVTTRRRDMTPFPEEFAQVEVSLFDRETAVAYLNGHLSRHGRSEPTAQLAELAADLGHLPLALSQAAAYLVTAGIRCDEYRRQFARKKLAAMLPDSSALPDGQAVTVATTWALSMQYANRLSVLAEPMLHLAAMLAPEGIPRTVLTAEPVRGFLAQFYTGDPSQGGTEPSPEDCTAALQALHRLSLIDHDINNPVAAVRVHQLVQKATREALSPDHFQVFALTAADGLYTAWPEDTTQPVVEEAVRANALALIDCANDALWSTDSVHPVLQLPGISLSDGGHLTAAVSYFTQLLAQAEIRLEYGSRTLRRLRRYLGRAQSMSGETQEGITTLSAVRDELTVLLQTTSPNGPETKEYADTLRDLAHALGHSGQQKAAAATLAELLQAVHSGSIGVTDFLKIRHDYAYWLLESGNTEKAQEVYEQVRDEKLRVLGPEDLETQIAQYELARLKFLSKRPAEAADDFEALLPIQRRLLGQEHPETLKTMAEAARARAVAEQDPRIAVQGVAEVLAIYLRTHEAQNPIVLHTRMDFIMWRHMARIHDGSLEEKGIAQDVAAMRSLLADMKKVLSSGAPLIRQSRHYLRVLLLCKLYVKKAGPTAAAAYFKRPITVTTAHRGPQ